MGDMLDSYVLFAKLVILSGLTSAGTPVQFMGDIRNSHALFAKHVILRAATLCSFFLAQRLHGGVSKDDSFRNARGD